MTVPDPDFVPAPAFYSPQQYRQVWDGLSGEVQVKARAMLVRLRDDAFTPQARDRYEAYLRWLDV